MARARTQMERELTADDARFECEDGGFGRQDTPRLAELMLDAYRGTIDDEGESLEDAVGVVDSLFDGGFGELDAAASIVFREGDTPVAATFVTHHDGHPLIAFSMTGKDAVRRGYARRGLHHAFGVLARSGRSDVRLVVTDGNDPAVTLYLSEGFRPVQHSGGS